MGMSWLINNYIHPSLEAIIHIEGELDPLWTIIFLPFLLAFHPS